MGSLACAGRVLNRGGVGSASSFRPFSERMAHAEALRFQIFLVVWVGRQADRDLGDDFQSVSFEAHDFFRVIGEELDFADAEVVEDLRTHAVVAEVRAKTEFFVGFDGVETFFLQLVSVDFRGKTDAAAFLAEVEEHAALDGNALKCGGELAATVAALGLENVASQALGVDADESGFEWVDGAFGEGEVVAGVGGNAVKMAVELAEVGGHFDRLLALDEFFRASAVFDELGDGAGLEVMLVLVGTELSDASHGSVIIHDFTDDGGLRESGEMGEVEGGLGVAGAAEHSV